MENRKKMFIVLSAIIGFLPVDYKCRDICFLNLCFQTRDGHHPNRLSWDRFNEMVFFKQLLQLFLLAYIQLDHLFMLLHGIHLWISSRITSQVRLWNSSPFAEAWLFCPKNIKFLSIERWSLISIWRVSGKLSVLPSSKGVLISYLCEPEQYDHINEGLVIVPMIIYMSKHWDSEEGFIYPVVFSFFWFELLDSQHTSKFACLSLSWFCSAFWPYTLKNICHSLFISRATCVAVKDYVGCLCSMSYQSLI